MTAMNKDDRLNLYKSLFRGRTDVFAIRWEKGNKSGYMPAYSFDVYRYRQHQIRGGTFQTFQEKTYQTLTDDQLDGHIKGEQVVGIYPLLEDNTSWFIAADFDEADWITECRKFINVCEEYDIPVYMERSRSGNGAHAWIFFIEPYEAFKSRKAIMYLLQKAGVVSTLDKNSSFDRLFPNQDYLSKKGLGNLIALPLYGKSLENGNSCFINPENLEPYKDQWTFLREIKCIGKTQLDLIYREQTNQEQPLTGLFQRDNKHQGKLLIRLGSEIKISREGIPPSLIGFLKEELNFANSAYQIKKNINKNTWGIKRYFKLFNETPDAINIPRGFIGRLLRFCREQQIEYILSDCRIIADTVNFKGIIHLRDYQVPAKQAADRKDFGVIVAPPGSGKTVLSLAIIKEKQQAALILVHRKQLADQWIERIESFLGISKREIGRIGQGKYKPGKQITVAMIQSVEKAIESDETSSLLNAFGTIIIDECHHVPAETYQRIVGKFNSRYLYGLTATPFRKYNDGKLIFIYLGEIIHEVKAPEVQYQKGVNIIARDTELFVPFNTKTDLFETLFKILVHDSARNQLILNDVISQLDLGKKAVIITERKEHITSLQQYLKQQYDVIALSGDDTEAGKKAKWAVIKKGDFQAIITTGQYFGEGTDIQNIECLFLVYPFAFEGKLIQYIGRVQRSEITPRIYDYRDRKIPYLEKLFQKRCAYYKKIWNADTAAVDDSEFISAQINEMISVAIENLEFKFGAIAFKYICSAYNNKEVEFEIENLNIRPEFAVLKPYFIRFLRSETLDIKIQATFQNNMLIFKSASSTDIDKINREVIESVKFRFLNKDIIKAIPKSEQNLLNSDQLQGNTQIPLYANEDELLEDILSQKKYKHHRHLRYLAQKHERSILKLRYVLEPFSFIFLISGDKQHHLVWETLDTEEATYIWHVNKNFNELAQKIKELDKLLSNIRIDGRQQFLQSDPSDFTRIVHDYTEDQKGFIIWKDHLEEKLF